MQSLGHDCLKSCACVLGTSFQVPEDGSSSPAAETSIEESSPYFYPDDGKCPKLSISSPNLIFLITISSSYGMVPLRHCGRDRKPYHTLVDHVAGLVHSLPRVTVLCSSSAPHYDVKFSVSPFETHHGGYCFVWNEFLLSANYN